MTKNPVVRTYRLVPGMAAAAALMVVSQYTAVALGQVLFYLQGIDPGGKASPVSAIVVAILLGMILGNIPGFRPSLRPGLDFAIKKVLRLGIVLVGLKLSFLDVLQLGKWGIPVVAIVVVVALLLAALLARWLGVSARLGTLTAAATCICGVTATVAIAPVIRADDREVAYTVANVTLFGILAMLFYPYLGHILFGQVPAAAGLFLGTAIHETSQVLGAALEYKEIFGSEVVLQVATITKLTRNVFLVAVVPVLGYLFARREGAKRGQVRLVALFPMFVLGFLAMAVLRSVGEASLLATGKAFGVWNGTSWKTLTMLVGDRFSFYALCTAMAALGLTTDVKMFRGFGLKPLYLGASVSVLVGLLGLALAALFGPLMGR